MAIAMYGRRKDGFYRCLRQECSGQSNRSGSLAAVYKRGCHDDPSKRGIVVVPGEIVSRMVLRKYKRGKNGQLLEKPVLVVKTKVVTSIPDSAVKQNIVFFSEPIAELVSVTDLSGNGVRAKALSSEKGVIGVGESSGVFSVVCNVTTGVTEPEVVSEKQNWRWKRDAEGNIVGMELIEEQE